MRDGEDIYDVKGVDRLLLDKYTDKEYGGSGQTFDWHGGSRIKTDKPIMLAGGIKTENVIEGISLSEWIFLLRLKRTVLKMNRR